MNSKVRSALQNLVTSLLIAMFLATQLPVSQVSAQLNASSAASATLSATTASGASELATPSTAVVQKIQEKKDQDITETGGKQKSKLVAFLENNPVAPLSWNNPLQHAIRSSVAAGVQPNIIVLVLLFPLIASFIAASRHIIGLRGFGIYIPAVLSVALVSTGIVAGILIFIAIILITLVATKTIRKARMPYLPRTAIMLWIVSLGLLGLILIAPMLNLVNLMSVNIFPLLILVLLSENFLDAQSRTKQSDALALTAETLGLAVFSGLILKWEVLQHFALTQPELLLISILILNLAIGKFTGLRITEYLRFRSIIEE